MSERNPGERKLTHTERAERRQSRRPSFISRHGGKVAVMAAGLAVIGGVKANQAGEARSENTQRVEALQEVDGIRDQVLIIDAKAALRTHPDNVTPSTDTDNSNIVARVAEGKKFEVHLPFVSSEYPGWIGFTVINEGGNLVPSTIEDRAKQTVWVNFDALEQQGLAHDNAYQGVQATMNSPIVSGDVLQNGNVMYNGHVSDGLDIAIGRELPADR